MATTERASKIDLKKCREYLERLQTDAYVTQLHSEKINPDDQRPGFDESVKQLVLLAEKQAKRTGDLHVVINYVNAIWETPIGKQIFANTEPKQEQRESPNAEDDWDEVIVPPLPKDVALPPEASIGACKWHDAYVKFSKERSPRSFQGFHEANGWALLSAVAKRRIVLYDLGAPKYTPLFIAIVARSSIASKTEAARVFIEVLKKAELKWVLGPDEITPQAMIDYMKEITFLNEAPKDGDKLEELRRNLAFAGQLGWFYEEFGENIEAICAKNSIMAPFKGILRRMDDNYDEFKRITISHKEQIVRDPYLSLLACMTPLDLRPYAGIDSPFWTNGFFARFAFIVPDTEEENNARFPKGNLYEAVPDKLTDPLKEWHKQLGQKFVNIEPIGEKNKKGEDVFQGYEVQYGPHPAKECEATHEAIEAFYKYGKALKAIIKKEKLDHFEGNYIRFPMMAMRIAMICASLENDGKIEMKHWAKGQEFAEQARRGLHYLWIELNKNSFANERSKLEDEIVNYVTGQKTWVTARMMTKNKFKGQDPKAFQDILDGLIKAGELTTGRNGKMVGYTIPNTEDKQEWPKKDSKQERGV